MLEISRARHPGLTLTSAALRTSLLAIAFAALACGPPPSPQPPPPPPVAPAPARAPAAEPAKPPSFSEWEKTSFGQVMIRDDLPDAFDVVVHFHVGKAAEPDYRASGLRAAVVALDHGLYAKPYGDAYEDQTRFPMMLDALTAFVRERTGRSSMTPGRIALVAWSAGYGAVRKILAQSSVPIDSVILLDGLHTAYRWQWKNKSIDRRDLEPFLHFAREAADGDKLLVVTHSSIEPGNYASTTETADALIASVKGARVTTDLEPSAGLTPTSRFDSGNFHVRGFEGDSKEVHVAQLHLLGLALSEYLLPRWSHEEAAPRVGHR